MRILQRFELTLNGFWIIRFLLGRALDWQFHRQATAPRFFRRTVRGTDCLCLNGWFSAWKLLCLIFRGSCPPGYHCIVECIIWLHYLAQPKTRVFHTLFALSFDCKSCQQAEQVRISLLHDFNFVCCRTFFCSTAFLSASNVEGGIDPRIAHH